MRRLAPIALAHGPFSFPSIPWPSPIRFRRRNRPSVVPTDPQHQQHVLPLRAGQSLLDRLERVHSLHKAKPTSLTQLPSATWDADAVLAERWGFSLRRLTSSIPGAGRGLFLTAGKVEKGDVITMYPGLIYRIPYDLEKCMTLDEATLTIRPPEFLIRNEYLLRFHDTSTDQHLLVDGCPRGPSALNFIKAMQKVSGHRLGNIEWLEGFSSRGCLLHQDTHQPAPLALVPGGDSHHLTLCRKLMTGALGMGHYVNDCHDATTNRTHPPTVEFHLYQLPREVPVELIKYIPNVNYDLEASLPYTVLVCAADTLEVRPGEPIELLATYTHSKHKLGFPLL